MIGWLLVLAACGGPAPRAPTPRVIEAGVAAEPTPDPAMAEVLTWLEQQRAAMCACADAACAEETDALGFQWSFDHKAVLDAARPTPAQDAAARAAIEASEACGERWPAASP